MKTSPPKSGYVPNLKITSLPGLIFLGVIALFAALLVIGLPSDWRITEGFLGTGASRMADLTLVAYIFLLIPLMVIGFAFAVRKKFVPNHQVTMTAVLIFNWGLILFIMAASFDSSVRPNVPDGLDERLYVLPFIHFLFGFAAQVLGTYLVIRMWFEDELPAFLKIKKIKTPMRLTLAFWLVAATLGIATYVTWYDVGGSSADSDEIAPDATPEITPEAEITTTQEASLAETPEATPDPAEAPVQTQEATPESIDSPVETPEVTPDS